MPVLSAVITIGFKCGSQAFIRACPSTLERNRKRLLFSGSSLTRRTRFKTSSSTSSHSTALVNIAFSVCRYLFAVEMVLPESVKPR